MSSDFKAILDAAIAAWEAECDKIQAELIDEMDCLVANLSEHDHAG